MNILNLPITVEGPVTEEDTAIFRYRKKKGGGEARGEWNENEYKERAGEREGE